jgi:hypothetical protein
MRLIWDANGKKYATRDPSPELIEELIEDLDNDTRTMVAIDIAGQSCLMVIGGAEGRVRVNYIPEDLNRPSSHMVDEQADSDLVRLRMQNKDTPYQRTHTVEKAVAIQALWEFIRSTKPSNDYNWQNDA